MIGKNAPFYDQKLRTDVPCLFYIYILCPFCVSSLLEIEKLFNLKCPTVFSFTVHLYWSFAAHLRSQCCTSWSAVTDNYIQCGVEMQTVPQTVTFTNLHIITGKLEYISNRAFTDSLTGCNRCGPSCRGGFGAGGAGLASHCPLPVEEAFAV